MADDDRRDLFEDQVPPDAPGVPGNVVEVVEDAVAHGVAADAHVPAADAEPAPAEPVEPAAVEVPPAG